ncbi:acyl-CoA N-acyltransferase [Lentinula detonsa]|uniref:Acyl-CoA N-acyltransferase n=1 Tax=Lentinula detonsa TaxID=2804962 RepID=A0A9W8NXE1_9AGAR|nr:acyl-CoA N-acyltransferase [Lentinula detonsa]KAJ3988726.1 acyl-CoA N-acyltransferase [Lentinula detonsa]
MSTGIHIRLATPEDSDAILQLIIDLAVYEKAPDAVKATPKLLRNNLFEKQYAHALLAMSGDKPVGLALYFFNYSTWTGRPGLYLEDLYVAPEYRKLGIGKAFFGELGKIAKETECARMDWSVLKWNQPSIDFYEKKLGAKPMSEWMGMRLEEDGIDSLQGFSLEAGASESNIQSQRK